MYAITTDQITRNLPEAIITHLPDSWFTRAQSDQSLFTSFFEWLSSNVKTITQNEIRSTTFIGKRLFKKIVQQEKNRLSKQQGFHGDHLDEHVAWTLLEYSSLTSISNCYISDTSIVVVPKPDLEKLFNLAEDIYQKKHRLHIARIKKIAQGHNFYAWMLAQTERPDDIGELARYMSLDDFWPMQLADIEELKAYLDAQSPKGLFHQELSAAWTEYLQQYPQRRTDCCSVTLT